MKTWDVEINPYGRYLFPAKAAHLGRIRWILPFLLNLSRGSSARYRPSPRLPSSTIEPGGFNWQIWLLVWSQKATRPCRWARQTWGLLNTPWWECWCLNTSTTIVKSFQWLPRDSLTKVRALNSMNRPFGSWDPAIASDLCWEWLKVWVALKTHRID